MAGMTRLQAVNRMLRYCGVRPVSALDTGGSSEAADAERALDDETHSGAVRGLYDNQLFAFSHIANLQGDIILGTAVLAVKSAGPNQHRHFSMRVNGANTQLFDLDRNTFSFGPNEQIFLDLTFEIPFEDAAPSHQEVILAAATEVFQIQFSGNPWKDQQLKRERVRAEVSINRATGQTGGVRDNPPPMAFQPPDGQGR